MARDKNKNRVEFQDSEGTTYFLRLGTNEFCEIQDDLAKTSRYNYSRLMLHKALTAGDPSQKDLTIEDAGDLMDDLGYARVKELVDRTAFGKNVLAASAVEEQPAAA